MQRRRRLTLLCLGASFALWGSLDVMASREAKLTGATHQAFDGALVFAWLSILVMLPFATALKPRPIRAGAIGALILGPVVSPMVFGHGWGLAPTAGFVMASAAALLPARSPIR
jgi:hypothetical protein